MKEDIQDDYIENKNLIFNECKLKINYLNEYFDYLGLNQDNISKSLMFEFTDIINKYPTNRKLFTDLEKTNLILIKQRAEDNQEKKYLQNSFNAVMKSLQNLNLKLKIEKVKAEKNISNQIEIDHSKFRNEIENIFVKALPFKDESDIFNLDVIQNLKTKILKQNSRNSSLKIELTENKMKLSKYLNLPSDINKIKEMIVQSKEKLKYLNSNSYLSSNN